MVILWCRWIVRESIYLLFFLPSIIDVYRWLSVLRGNSRSEKGTKSRGSIKRGIALVMPVLAGEK